MGGAEVDAGVWWRPMLPSNWSVEGPAVIEEEVGTTVVAEGDTAVVAADGTLEVRWT